MYVCERETHVLLGRDVRTCVMRNEREWGGSEREQVIAREREQDRKG